MKWIMDKEIGHWPVYNLKILTKKIVKSKNFYFKSKEKAKLVIAEILIVILREWGGVKRLKHFMLFSLKYEKKCETTSGYVIIQRKSLSSHTPCGNKI